MKTTTSIKLDPVVHKKAQELSEELGLSLSSVVNVLLTQFTKSRELTLTTLPVMSVYLESVIQETDELFAKGKLDTYSSLDDLMKVL